ncbi:hypothetical protein [Pyxidicoccus xibeiensis]|uniref:hypothetical protein n=1 Tax=Pyxidicoccus xibeiensis TaxID=2906759 RepID=UPI0020A7F19F|nr:hypothetical protein [Pyxidicoccus xibeiensis]MCP3136576.1 hypothetical protein [Pyxidicoccus xibeiensis]
MALGDEGAAEAADLGFTRDGWPERLERDEAALGQARRAEAERVVRELWDLAAARATPGEAWRFEYQSQGGALTLLAFRRLSEGRSHAAPDATWSAFERKLGSGLPTLLGEKPKRVIFTLEREAHDWDVDLEADAGEVLPLARTLPVVLSRAPEPVWSQALHQARTLLRTAPRGPGGAGSLEARAHYEGVALTWLEFAGWTGTRREGAARVDAEEDSVAYVADALLPFSHGLGTRTVALKLEGAHRHGEPRARWRVTEARTLEPPAPPRAVEDFAREYRAMHESILRDWRTEVVGSAKLAGAWSFEQLAHWLVGGLVVKGALRLFGVAAPTVVSVLSKGGKQSVQWFRTVLLRTPAVEREALQRLWTKVEVQGLASLSHAERAELQSLLGKVESRLRAPLREKYVKDKLREWARREYFETHRPGLAMELGPERLSTYQVHHHHPLEYAHLFPERNINAAENLVGMADEVHESVNAIWELVRKSPGGVSARQAEAVVGIINTHYGRWFHAVYDASKSSRALLAAEQLALRDVRRLLGM